MAWADHSGSSWHSFVATSAWLSRSWSRIGTRHIESRLPRDDRSANRFHWFLLRRAQGRLTDVEAEEPGRRQRSSPWYPLHRAALACLLAETGREGEARRVLTDLGQDDFAALIRDNEWLVGACLAADAATLLHDGSAATVLYEQLAPFAGRLAIGHAEGSVGVVDRCLRAPGIGSRSARGGRRSP